MATKTVVTFVQKSDISNKKKLSNIFNRYFKKDDSDKYKTKKSYDYTFTLSKFKLFIKHLCKDYKDDNKPITNDDTICYEVIQNGDNIKVILSFYTDNNDNTFIFKNLVNELANEVNIKHFVTEYTIDNSKYPAKVLSFVTNDNNFEVTDQYILQYKGEQSIKDLSDLLSCLSHISYRVFDNGGIATSLELQYKLYEYNKEASHEAKINVVQAVTEDDIILDELFDIADNRETESLLHKDIKRSDTGCNLLHELARRADTGYSHLVSKAFELGVSVTDTDYSYRTPLHYACYSACYGGDPDAAYELVAALLDKGARIDATDYDGITPLAIVEGHGCEDLLYLLLKRGSCSDRCD